MIFETRIYEAENKKFWAEIEKIEMLQLNRCVTAWL